MSFFPIIKIVRINKEISDKVKSLMLDSPEVFESESHVYRCAINYLYNKQ